MKTATSDRLIERTVKPTSCAPSSAALKRGMPSSRCRIMFSRTTIASSTTKPVEMVSAISERLSRLKPKSHMTPIVPSSETGTATVGMRPARGSRRNANTTRITRTTAIDQRALDIVDRSADGRRTVFNDIELDVAGDRRFELRQRRRYAIDRTDDIGAGLRKTSTSTAGAPFANPKLRRFSTESSTSATSESRTAAPLR